MSSIGVGARLRRDLKAANLSVRGLAKLLAGDGADKDEVERQRRYVNRWLALNHDHGLTQEKAEEIADLLGTDPSRYLSPRFNRRRQLERQLARLQEETRLVRDQIARLPKP